MIDQFSGSKVFDVFNLMDDCFISKYINKINTHTMNNLDHQLQNLIIQDNTEKIQIIFFQMWKNFT